MFSIFNKKDSELITGTDSGTQWDVDSTPGMDTMATSMSPLQPVTLSTNLQSMISNISSSLNTITLSGTGGGYAPGYGPTPILTNGTGAAGTLYGTSGWTTVGPTPMVNIQNTGMQVRGDADFQGDVTIRGINVLDLLKSIQDRLAILVPDPKKLETFEALKLAYEHYKTLEALCVDEVKPLDAP
jgi:hypothetical protein